MKHCLLYIFSLFLSLASFASYAQQDSIRVDSVQSVIIDDIQIDTVNRVVIQDSVKSDSLTTVPVDIVNVNNKAPDNKPAARSTEKNKKERVKSPDSLKIKINSGLQFYIDYGKIATLVSDFEQKYEFGIGYQFSFKVQPNFQYGIGEVEPSTAIENGKYLAEGSYWRAGINFMVPLDNINSLFLGVKYAQAQFDDSGSYEITSELWPTFTEEFSRSGFTADWYSIILGSEKKLMNGQFIIGGQTGVRILNERDEADFIDIYSIPGYGLTSGKSNPFLNLYIKYHLKF